MALDIRSKFTIAAETTGQASVDNLARSVGKVEQGVNRLPAAAKSAVTAFAGFATVGVGALVAATKGAIDYASAIVDASEQTGLGVESFQALRFAAGQAGVSAEAFTAAMLRFNTTIGAAANGSKAQADLFARMGVAIRDTNGNVRDGEAILNDFADGLERIDSPAQQARASAEAFGRAAGPQLAVLLREGSDGLAELQQRAREAGAVLSEDTARKAEDAGDKLQILSDVLKTQLAAVLIELIPVLSAAGEQLVGLAAGVREFFDGLDEDSLKRINSEIIQLSDHIDRVDLLIENSNGSLELRNRLLEAQTKNLEKLNALYARQRAAVGAGVPPPSEAPATSTAGAVEQTSAERAAAARAAAAEARQRAAAARAEERDPSDFPGSQRIRDDLATEAQEAERLRDVIGDIEGALPALADEASESVQALWETNNDIAERALQDLQDITGAAAQGIADTLEEGVFALFAEGADGMVDVFNRALQRMILDLANSAIQEELQKLFTEALGGGKGSTGGIVSSLIDAFAGSFGGGELSKSGASGPSGGAKFASGGSFIVPGPNSGDRVIPIFRANGGERVTVSQPGSGGAAPGVSIVNNIDARGADPASEARIRREIEASERRTIAQVAALAKRGRL